MYKAPACTGYCYIAQTHVVKCLAFSIIIAHLQDLIPSLADVFAYVFYTCQKQGLSLVDVLENALLTQAHAGHKLACTWFLSIVSVWTSVLVCVYVCVSAPRQQRDVV